MLAKIAPVNVPGLAIFVAPAEGIKAHSDRLLPGTLMHQLLDNMAASSQRPVAGRTTSFFKPLASPGGLVKLPHVLAVQVCQY